MKWINATDISAWADRLDSKSRFPELLRRLVHATVSQPRKVDFASEESVQLGGWDGLVETTEQHLYVPAGYSGWELGAGQKVKSKADSDYDKRTKNPGTLDPSKSAFIFATPRKWSHKDQWIQDKAAQNIWAQVKAYDADDIEQWLELAPAVASWFAAIIGKYPEGCLSLDDYFRNFCDSTSPPLNIDLLVAGRSEGVNRIKEWLKSPASAITVEADSAPEAIAFVAAALLSQAELECEHWISRAIVVNDRVTLQAISVQKSSLLIASFIDDPALLGSAISHGHRVIIPRSSGRLDVNVNNPYEHTLTLPRIATEAFVTALSAAGIKQDDARVLARETGRSIPVLIRRIPATGRPAVPPWAIPENAQSFVPILLAGSWVDGKPSDCEALEALAKGTYEAINRTLARWAVEPDAPVFRIGDEWRLVSPLDAWHLLGPALTPGDLQRFGEITIKVLSKDDPALDLEAKDRWAAAVYDKQHIHSPSLREGLAKSLVLLATVGPEVPTLTRHQPQGVVDAIVRSVLGGRPGWARWYSVSDLLPLLAEASPESFLSAVEDELDPPKPDLMKLFNEEGGWMPHSRHTGLLWALESLAWFPAYLGRVAAVLGRLAALDPGGQIANRPIRSLRNLFLPWHPCTCAPSLERVQALDVVITRTPDVGWKLLLDLLPKSNDVAAPTHEPRWRQRTEVTPLTREAYSSHLLAIIERALSLANNDPVRLRELAQHIANLPAPQRATFMGQLDRYARSNQGTPHDIALWDELRDIVNRHHRFSGADWALPEQELMTLDSIMSLLQPTSTLMRIKWLFDDWFPEVPGNGDHHAQVQAIDDARMQAMKSLREDDDLGGIFTLARVVRYPGVVGKMLAEMPDADEFAAEVLNATLGMEDLGILGISFARRLIEKCGVPRFDEIAKIHYEIWDDAAKTDLLLALPPGRVTWARVRNETSGIQESYWRNFQWFQVPNEDIPEGITQLVKHKRAIDALRASAYRLQEVPTTLIITLLDMVIAELNSASPDMAEATARGLHGYEIEQVLNALQHRDDVAESDLARLEWSFLPLLGSTGARSAPTLEKLVTRDPSLFANLIQWCYHPPSRETADDQNERTISDLDAARARQAYDLLSSTTRVPGTTEDGRIDGNALGAWINSARELCAKSGRGEVGDHHMGRLLAQAPADSDGIWPAREVREQLERLANRDIEEGFHNGAINDGGIIARNPMDGGLQERELAKKYSDFADRTASGWPRTSAMLRSLARTYEALERSHDDDARRWDVM